MSDIQIALDAIRAKLPDCQRFSNYYNGRHTLTFASEKFATTFGQTLRDMRDNLCPIVVDAPADRMEVINFSSDSEGKKVADDAWEIWQRERLELVSNEVHREALKCGQGYVIVWVDEDGKAKFYEQDARQCVLIEDEDTARPLFGAKQWVTFEKYVRLTLYYPDRIEKYISRKKFNGQVHDALKETGFQFIGEESNETAVTPNPYGVIPLFKFETWPVLTDAIPIQDALNKTLADRLVTQEFGAFRQRWATGLQPPIDEITGIPTLPFKAGVDRLWFTNEDKVTFGEFSATDLEPYLKAADSDRLEMARVTGTPLHFFSINTSDAISGEALKTLESRFIKKVRRLTINFGVVWANAMKFALTIEGRPLSEDNLTTQWDAPEQKSDKEILENLLLKQELGVPDDVLFEEYGYTKEDIKKFKTLDQQEPDEAVLNAQRMPNETITQVKTTA
jgi:hypothetical protein